MVKSGTVSLLLFLLLCGKAALAQQDSAVYPAASQTRAASTTAGFISEGGVRRIMEVLAGDSLEGRGNFQPGLLKAAKFIGKEFARAGLLHSPAMLLILFLSVRQGDGKMKRQIFSTGMAARKTRLNIIVSTGSRVIIQIVVRRILL